MRRIDKCPPGWLVYRHPEDIPEEVPGAIPTWFPADISERNPRKIPEWSPTIFQKRIRKRTPWGIPWSNWINLKNSWLISNRSSSWRNPERTRIPKKGSWVNLRRRNLQKGSQQVLFPRRNCWHVQKKKTTETIPGENLGGTRERSTKETLRISKESSKVGISVEFFEESHKELLE